MKLGQFRVPHDTRIKLADYDTGYTADFKSKKDAAEQLAKDIERMAELQDVMYAHDSFSLLIIFQAMDAAGKDGTIKHVMSGVNPQGCQVFNFKAPSAEELDHDYLWRCIHRLPERGRIGIFNRSYYEEVLITRVHPEILERQKHPVLTGEGSIWKQRFREINNLERYLVDNGIVVLKFFLNVSKEEQRTRFLERINTPEKNWKFSKNDVSERAYWAEYMNAFEEVFNHTSTETAPWYIIPADHKWFARLTVAQIIVRTLERLELHYPKSTEAHLAELQEARAILEAE